MSETMSPKEREAVLQYEREKAWAWEAMVRSDLEHIEIRVLGKTMAEAYAENYIKGFAEGFAESYAKFFSENYEEHYAEGYALGQSKAPEHLIQNLLKTEFTARQIAKCTNLSVEEIQRMRVESVEQPKP